MAPLDEHVLLTSYTGAEAAVADDEDVVLRRRIAGLRARYDEHLWSSSCRMRLLRTRSGSARRTSARRSVSGPR